MIGSKSLHLKESASRDLDFLVTSQGPIAFLVQATKTFLNGKFLLIRFCFKKEAFFML